MMIAKLRSAFLLGVAVSLGACAYHAPDAPTVTTPPPSTSAAEIRLVTSSRSDFTTAVSAEVLTAQQHFVPNAVITFAVTAGTVSPAQATTDVNGMATAIITAPTNTTVTATLGTLAASVPVIGASAPIAPTPPTPPPPAPPIPPTTPTPQPTPPLPPATIGLPPATTTAGVSVFLTVGAFMGGQSIASTAWNFGDSTTGTATGGGIAHTYAGAGTFTAAVTATDALGRTASNSALITVLAAPVTPPPPPPAPPALAASMTCVVGTSTTPTDCNISGTYGGTAVPSTSFSVTWDWGDGTTAPGGAGPLGTRQYSQSGTYLIVATATGTSGAWIGQTSTVQKSIAIP